MDQYEPKLNFHRIIFGVHPNAKFYKNSQKVKVKGKVILVFN
jgi:hypothetical protein